MVKRNVKIKSETQPESKEEFLVCFCSKCQCKLWRIHIHKSGFVFICARCGNKYYPMKDTGMGEKEVNKQDQDYSLSFGFDNQH